MTKDDARQVALDYVRAAEREAGLDIVLLDNMTLERRFGWVFFYDSKRHVETGNLRDSIAGNSPIVVTKDGRVHETGTALPLEDYLVKFEM